LARLAVEAKARGDAAALDVWREARTRVGSNEEDVMEVWLWGVEHCDKGDAAARKLLHEVR
jgi:hypothetical protein